MLGPGAADVGLEEGSRRTAARPDFRGSGGFPSPSREKHVRGRAPVEGLPGVAEGRKGDPRGRRLAWFATPPGIALGLGFALPFYLGAVPIWSALLLAGRHRKG